MARLSRSASRARTREKLLDAAQQLFRSDGYASTSVDRIAESAGFSKGAVYANFENKEAIFLAVLATQCQDSLNALLPKISGSFSPATAIDALVAWANARSRSGSWSLTILEHARVGTGTPSLQRQEIIIRDQWRQLGACLLARFPWIAQDSETLGALLHEIAYAPAMTFIAQPCAGDLMRLAMESLLRPALPVFEDVDGASSIKRNQLGDDGPCL